MNMETWKDIEGYEGFYQISNYGNIRSLNYNKTGQIKNLSLAIDKAGYAIVTLAFNGKHKTYKVHRLVAQSFIPNPDNLPCVNHKNELKYQNNVDNLEWCTYKYNNNYGTRNERIRNFAINRVDQSKKVYQYTIDGILLKIWPSTKECGRNGYIQSSVQRCCVGECLTHKGYKWYYQPL